MTEGIPVRLGLIGCGEVTQVMHIPSLSMLPEQFSVTALCDISQDVLNGLSVKLGIRHLYQDFHDLIARDDIDAVLVANPNPFHAEAVLAAVKAGKHVLVEKPMCVNLREADAIIEAAADRGVTVQVGYMRRYAPAFVEACRIIKDLGPVRMARVHDLIGMNSLFTQSTSRVIRGKDIPGERIDETRAQQKQLAEEAIGQVPQDLQTAYNLLLGLGSHDISAMRELLGPPKGVLSATCRQGGVYLSATFDYGDFVCHYETGVDQIPRFDAHLEVYGKGKLLRVQYDTPYIRNLPVKLFLTESDGTGGLVRRDLQPSLTDPFVCEWQAFHDSIRHKQPPKCSPADFREDLVLFSRMLSLMA